MKILIFLVIGIKDCGKFNTITEQKKMNLNIAVLIDGENIPSAHVQEMMEEIAKYGNPTIKRIYGDWTKPRLSKWKTFCLKTPSPLFSNTAILLEKMPQILQ